MTLLVMSLTRSNISVIHHYTGPEVQKFLLEEYQLQYQVLTVSDKQTPSKQPEKIINTALSVCFLSFKYF